MGGYFGVIATLDFQAAFLRGCETKVFQLCSMIIYLYKEWEAICGDVPGINIKLYASIGQRMYRLFHMHITPLPSFPVHPSIYEMDVEEFLAFWQPPLENESTLHSLRSFRRDLQCSAQGCMNSIQLAGRSFQKCVHCGLAPYCGRECQTKAWKHEQYISS